MIDYEALAKRLADGVEDLELGKNVMLETMPLSVTKGVIIRSSLSGDPIDYEIPGLARSHFRLIARSAKFLDAQSLLYEAIEALMIERPVQVGRMRVRTCRPISTPVVFPLSDGNLREFMVNMQIIYDFNAQECPWLKTSS